MMYNIKFLFFTILILFVVISCPADRFLMIEGNVYEFSDDENIKIPIPDVSVVFRVGNNDPTATVLDSTQTDARGFFHVEGIWGAPVGVNVEATAFFHKEGYEDQYFVTDGEKRGVEIFLKKLP